MTIEIGWINSFRPGYFGSKRDQIFREYDAIYGEGRWRVMWKFGDAILDMLGICKIYEEAYYQDSFQRKNVWQNLSEIAGQVYDIECRDVESGTDYAIQKGNATHIQDIAIRNVFTRRGWHFKGLELVQIRGHDTQWGRLLSPGKVVFHKKELIIQPSKAPKWADKGSVEDFYQSNKVLQTRGVVKR